MTAVRPNTIILALKNEVVADVYSLALEGVFRSHVILCEDPGKAGIALRQNPDACVLVESTFPEPSLKELFQKQVSFAKRGAVVVLGGSSSLLPGHLRDARVRFLESYPKMNDVVAEVESILKLETDADQFCRIALKSLLMSSGRLQCDVYIKLSDNKFVKVLNANDPFDLQEYERFRQKSVTHLYLPRQNFLLLMDDLLEKVAVLNSAPDKLTIDDAVSTTAAIFETVQAAFESEGFTPQLQNLTVASVSLAINTMKKNPRLGELLERLDAKRDSYISWHTTALSFVSCKLATLLGWHSEATFYKLSLASMLHDLTLDTDEHARLITKMQLYTANLPPEVFERVLQHPIEAALLVNGFDEVPGEVGFIVEQHHEREDGSGYPKGIDHKDISPISALFIIAHDIVTTMYDAPPERFQMADFLTARELEKVYNRGAFGQVFRSLMTKLPEM